MPAATSRESLIQAPGSHTSLRTANQRRVLDVLRSGTDAYTQAELARLTGLAPATVSNIVRDLSAAQLVDTKAGSGRRGSAIRLSRNAGLIAGVDFGHSHIGVAIGTLTGEIIADRRAHLTKSHTYDDSLALATTMIAELTPPGEKVLRAAMGLPAPITENVVVGPRILPGWNGADSRAHAEHYFGVPVDVENDANLGALAEHRRGVAQGCRSSVFVKISSGVGAGIMLNDALFHGAAGTAGELGHLTLDQSGPHCRCGGRGCLEAYTSVDKILERTAGQLNATCLDDVIEAAQAGQATALRAFEETGLHLGWGLAAVAALLNPEVIVIGGDMARAGELLLESARIGLRRHALDAVAQTPVTTSHLGQRASLVGAVLLAAERTELAVD